MNTLSIMTIDSRTYFLGKLDNRFTLPCKPFAGPSRSQEIAKRVFDIIFALTVLSLGFPIYFLLAILTYCSSPGSVFFSHQRIGKNHKPFGCIKFRTMVPNADKKLQEVLEKSPALRQEFENTFKLKNDPRVTWIGKFLRVTSLDELPQFINVLRGDMSVVGPRPLVQAELAKYGADIDRVLSVKPGVTGLWQVSGRNDIAYEHRVKLDVFYINNCNLFMDFWLVMKTIGVMVLPKNNGAY